MRGVVVVGLLALAIAAAGVAAANEPPMAEAGLDQDSTVNSTVYLDAGGSLDPDGDIVSYDWAIERPNGTTTVPDCGTCSLTHFVPMRSGQYNVTVTVTDDDGASINDTMYVTVEGLFIPPSAPSPGGGSGGARGGGGWGGGGNSDRITYNYQSGNVWIDLAEGSNNVQLPGAERDPADWGADFNAWITDDEIDDLVRRNLAERYDNRIKVTGWAADQLRSSLDPNSSMEHEHTPARTLTRATQTVNNVLDYDPEDYGVNEDSENSGSSKSESTTYSPPEQRAEGADSNSDDSSDSTSSNSSTSSDYGSDGNDSHSYEYGPEGCTMAAFC
jgi:hypothetical protein